MLALLSLRVGALKRLTLLHLGVQLLLGCGRPEPVTSKPLPSPVRSVQAESLDKSLVSKLLQVPEGEAYKVGPGDTLVVAVYGHPELSLAHYTGSSQQGNYTRNGLVVDNDGTIQLPLLGSVAVSGNTTNDLRTLLESRLSAYINDPKVTVQVVFAGSIRYYLLGQFTNPGLKYSDRPLRLLEGMSMAGSIELESCSLRTAYVAREGKRLPVNFRRLMLEGDLTQNIQLVSGDVVVVPDKQNEAAFVFGGASGSVPKGGRVEFMHGKLTLAQALGHIGIGWREQYRGLLSETRVIRSEGDRAELFVVDAEAILTGEAAPFELAPGDVVFVPATALTNWNEALAQILPSLQTISGVLTPFVQIKFLSE